MSNDGAVMIAGMFDTSITFSVTTSGPTVTLAGGGSGLALVGKLDATGSWVRATSAGSVGNEEAFGLAVGSDGEAIITGYFEGTMTVGGTVLTSAGSGDVFAVKIDASGGWRWGIRAGGAGYDTGVAVSALDGGASVVVGEFRNTIEFGSSTLTSTGNTDVVVTRVPTDGLEP